jgi:hypothetical protein
MAFKRVGIYSAEESALSKGETLEEIVLVLRATTREVDAYAVSTSCTFVDAWFMLVLVHLSIFVEIRDLIYSLPTFPRSPSTCLYISKGQIRWKTLANRPGQSADSDWSEDLNERLGTESPESIA